MPVRFMLVSLIQSGVELLPLGWVWPHAVSPTKEPFKRGIGTQINARVEYLRVPSQGYHHCPYDSMDLEAFRLLPRFFLFWSNTKVIPIGSIYDTFTNILADFHGIMNNVG